MTSKASILVSPPPPFRPPGPPPARFPERWASDWGEDRYGLWQALTYKGVRQVLRWIPPSPEPFLMGSPPDEHERCDDETQHPVTLTRGFWLAETACTQALWEAVTGKRPSHFEGADRPVEQVSWHQAQGFLDSLNAELDAFRTQAPARRLGGSDPAGAMPGEGEVPRLRLPSEAEWEYACRAGTSGPFSFGEDIDPEQANFDGNHPYRGRREGLFRQETVPVASLPPNPWGLYEMHGNVWEWCQDRWAPYPRGPATDPVGPATGGRRVLRGGSWGFHARNLRSADRARGVPGYRIVGTGFRLALGSRAPASR